MRIYYTSPGSVGAVAPPDALKAIVGPGYVVCVFARGVGVAGLVHITQASPGGRGGPCKLPGMLGELDQAFERLGGSLRGASAEIIGGADLIQAGSMQAHQQKVEGDVRAIHEALGARNVRVTRSRVGGARGRVVEVMLPSAAAYVSFASRDRQPRLTSRAHDPECGVASPEPPQAHGEELVVNMGCIQIARAPTRLVAILGSCVAVSVADASTGLGGLAHVALPKGDGAADLPAKYAENAVPALLERLLEQGAARETLRAKLVGGANLLFERGSSGLSELGASNIKTSRERLAQLGIPIEWEDVGGRFGRRVSVRFDDFRVLVRLLDPEGQLTPETKPRVAQRRFWNLSSRYDVR